MRRDSPLSLPEAERSLAASPAEPKPADKESRDGAESTFGEGKLKQQDENVDKGRNRELSEKLSETKSKTGAALKGVKDADRFEKLEASDRPRSSSPPLLWEHLAADEKGEAEIDLKLPSEPGEYWLMIDAYGPGGVGKLQKRLLVRVPPATGAGPAGLPAPATEVKPE